MKTVTFKELTEELGFEFVSDVESYIIHKDMPNLKLVLRNFQVGRNRDSYDLKNIMIACFFAGEESAKKKIKNALGIFE